MSSLTVNLHATGRYNQVSFKVEAMAAKSSDMMLDMVTQEGGVETADVTVFLSQETARSLVAALAGHLDMTVYANDGMDVTVRQP